MTYSGIEELTLTTLHPALHGLLLNLQLLELDLQLHLPQLVLGYGLFMLHLSHLHLALVLATHLVISMLFLVRPSLQVSLGNTISCLVFLHGLDGRKH